MVVKHMDRSYTHTTMTMYIRAHAKYAQMMQHDLNAHSMVKHANTDMT